MVWRQYGIIRIAFILTKLFYQSHIVLTKTDCCLLQLILLPFIIAFSITSSPSLNKHKRKQIRYFDAVINRRVAYWHNGFISMCIHIYTSIDGHVHIIFILLMFAFMSKCYYQCNDFTCHAFAQSDQFQRIYL